MYMLLCSYSLGRVQLLSLSVSSSFVLDWIPFVLAVLLGYCRVARSMVEVVDQSWAEKPAAILLSTVEVWSCEVPLFCSVGVAWCHVWDGCSGAGCTGRDSLTFSLLPTSAEQLNASWFWLSCSETKLELGLGLDPLQYLKHSTDLLWDVYFLRILFRAAPVVRRWTCYVVSV